MIAAIVARFFAGIFLTNAANLGVDLEWIESSEVDLLLSSNLTSMSTIRSQAR